MLDDICVAGIMKHCDAVDSMVREAARDPENVRWAFSEGLSDDYPVLRELSVMLLEASDLAGAERRYAELVLPKLATQDPSDMVRYRSACAMLTLGIDKDIAAETLQEACKDREFGEVAERYLRNYVS